ncbi:hypothetical protein I79_003552 [Cricetulus griseus]|uniref:Uncharacterized protein n=1 Tax=Cricetulus griseus TaxID=10029 RepID=G3H076_CRIGR|nr:hypothetical protein I79_003552 [Cricetulus griseus]
MIQDGEAEPTGYVIQKRGYGQWDFRNKFNFGFPTFSDQKIKAGLRRPLSSESCYVSSFGKAKAGGREKGFPIIG